MKQEILINEIVNATKEVIEELLEITPSKLETANYIDENQKYELSVFNSIAGETKGLYLIRVNKDTAKNISEKLEEKIDNEKPLCYLSNKITAVAKRRIIDQNIDFSESAVIDGSDVQFSFSRNSKIRVIEMELENFGTLSLVIAYKSK